MLSWSNLAIEMNQCHWPVTHDTTSRKCALFVCCSVTAVCCCFDALKRLWWYYKRQSCRCAADMLKWLLTMSHQVQLSPPCCVFVARVRNRSSQHCVLQFVHSLFAFLYQINHIDRDSTAKHMHTCDNTNIIITTQIICFPSFCNLRTVKSAICLPHQNTFQSSSIAA